MSVNQNGNALCVMRGNMTKPEAVIFVFMGLAAMYFAWHTYRGVVTLLGG